MEPDQAFLEYVVKALVDNSDDVETARIIDQMGVLLTLTVHPDDMGKIIGKSGKTAEALRILLRVVGMKGNARVNLKINEPAGGTRISDISEKNDTQNIKTVKTVDDIIEEI